MKVPMLDLTPQYEPIRDKVFDAIKRVYDSKKFIMGPEVSEFEKNAARYVGAKHAVAVSSGTDALLVALMALKVAPGDEVITTDFSFFATAGVIARTGATPVFADIDPVTYNVSPSEIEKKISPRTRAIIAVHLYGQCADMEPIVKIAAKNNIKVIEDAAQSLGAEYKNSGRAGTLGDVGCFSFFPSKNLGAMGDAGLVTTNDDALAERIRLMRVHGAQQKYYHKFVGGNFRMDTIQAAVLDVKLPYLDGWTASRQRNAMRYEKLFRESGLTDKGLISLPRAVYREYHEVKHYHIYNQFVIRCASRDELKKFLDKNEVGNDIYYPLPFHLQECFAHLGGKKGDYPHSEKAASEVLAIPVYPELSAEQQEYVVGKIKEFYGV